MELDELREVVNKFEAIIERALDQKYEQCSPEIKTAIRQANILRRWDLRKLLETYQQAQCYPVERLERIVYDLFDIKLQFYYILEVDLGLYNLLVQDMGYDTQSALTKPHILLTRFSLDQSLISKSRILWERIMNFVYYLETGQLLEHKVSGKKSKRKVFFNFVKTTPKWRFLEPYEKELQIYEESFRIPEFHKSSVLRAELFGNRLNNPNDLIKLVNRATNIIWENILAIISGQEPSYFTDLHFDPHREIDKRYME
jgi:hypothetical protein